MATLVEQHKQEIVHVKSQQMEDTVKLRAEMEQAHHTSTEKMLLDHGAELSALRMEEQAKSMEQLQVKDHGNAKVQAQNVSLQHALDEAKEELQST